MGIWKLWQIQEMIREQKQGWQNLHHFPCNTFLLLPPQATFILTVDDVPPLGTQTKLTVAGTGKDFPPAAVPPSDTFPVQKKDDWHKWQPLLKLPSEWFLYFPLWYWELNTQQEKALPLSTLPVLVTPPW